MNSSHDGDVKDPKFDCENPIEEIKIEEPDFEDNAEAYYEYEFLIEDDVKKEDESYSHQNTNYSESDSDENDVVETKPVRKRKLVNWGDRKVENGSDSANSDSDKETNATRSSPDISDDSEDDEDPDFIDPTPKCVKKEKRKQEKGKDPNFKPAERTCLLVNNRMTLVKYKRTTSRIGCIFLDCDKNDTVPVPNIARRKLLLEYKLYVLPCNEVCSIHHRDQNWEELLKCTYNDFTPEHIQGMLILYKQISEADLNFEEIEYVPTKYVRYFLNVNKVQFQRIFDGFPALHSLESPKTSLAIYLMHLQNSNTERISQLLQVPESKIITTIKMLKEIGLYNSYSEFDERFSLEY